MAGIILWQRLFHSGALHPAIIVLLWRFSAFYNHLWKNTKSKSAKSKHLPHYAAHIQEITCREGAYIYNVYVYT